MQLTVDCRKNVKVGLAVATIAFALCSGCGGADGPAIDARPQTISFGGTPSLTLYGTTTVAATASSGLPVRYSSATPTVCSVNSTTGLVTDFTTGACVIAANQSGNSHYAPAAEATLSIPVIANPNQTITFAAAPALTLGGTAQVSAAASSGLPVTYSSTTPTVCTVDSVTGLVTNITAGACIIAADQAGDADYTAAPQATQTLTVSVAPVITVPGAPTGVAATLAGPVGGATTPHIVTITIGATDSGGSPITGYTVSSKPTGITATGTTPPITVTCPSTCAGYAFAVVATNIIGDGAESAPADVTTAYDVVETFWEPDTQPNNSIFIGTFTFNSTTGTVSDLQGVLSESMTGDQIAYPDDNMTWLSLTHQLSSAFDATLGGLLVTTFLLPTTNTLSDNPTFGGTDGWSPGTGFGLHYGFPGNNPGNAYAMIFVNTADPTAALTHDQIDKLAYADCTPGGMMGSTCMTGTTIAGYGSLGSMSGHPVSQAITKR